MLAETALAGQIRSIGPATDPNPYPNPNPNPTPTLTYKGGYAGYLPSLVSAVR